MIVVSHTCNVLGICLEPTNPNADWHLGGMMFYDIASKIVESVVADNLYNDLIKTSSKKGIEVARSGGALGLCDPNDRTFQAFMKQRAKSPLLQHFKTHHTILLMRLSRR